MIYEFSNLINIYKKMLKSLKNVIIFLASILDGTICLKHKKQSHQMKDEIKHINQTYSFSKFEKGTSFHIIAE